jgi:NADPH:quinone reductase-like Zn-dependent oxidoreductase
MAATPNAVSDEVAACLPVASGTALQALTAIAQLREGQSILITGASGAVGSSAVQIARSIGARITGVCSTANIDYVRSIGADEVVDYKTTDWHSLGKTFDVIFDAAGASTFGAARPQLSPAGFYLNTFPRLSMFLTSKIIGLTSRQHSIPFMLKTDVALLKELAQLAEQQVLQPRIAQTIRLEDVATAQRRMHDGQIHGKVCVRISE